MLNAMEKRKPDTKWLLMLVAIFIPDDEIFRKDWRYVKSQKSVPVEPMLDNQDGMWDNLPQLTESQIRKTNRLRLPKAMRQEL